MNTPTNLNIFLDGSNKILSDQEIVNAIIECKEKNIFDYFRAIESAVISKIISTTTNREEYK